MHVVVALLSCVCYCSTDADAAAGIVVAINPNRIVLFVKVFVSFSHFASFVHCKHAIGASNTFLSICYVLVVAPLLSQ